MSKSNAARDNKKSSRSPKHKQRDAIRREVSFLTFDGKRPENRAVDRKSVNSIGWWRTIKKISVDWFSAFYAWSIEQIEWKSSAIAFQFFFCYVVSLFLLSEKITCKLLFDSGGKLFQEIPFLFANFDPNSLCDFNWKRRRGLYAIHFIATVYRFWFGIS